MNRPPRPQFVFRPNLRCEDDRRAWQLLQAAPDGNRKALIVRALLQSEQEHRLEETVRRAVPPRHRKTAKESQRRRWIF